MPNERVDKRALALSEDHEDPPPYSSLLEAYPLEVPMALGTPRMIPLEQLGDREAWIDCPFCRRPTRSRVQKEIQCNIPTIVAALFCGLCTCCVIPVFVAEHCQTVVQYCGECEYHVMRRPYNGLVEIQSTEHSVSVPSQYAMRGDEREVRNPHHDGSRENRNRDELM